MLPQPPLRAVSTRRGFLARILALTGSGLATTAVPRAIAAPSSTQVDYPYIGEIRIVAFNFAPVGWASCNGSLLPISENTALFFLLGTTYGGDGETTFALPDLRGRLPMHQGAGYVLGEQGGAAAVSLLASQIPGHAHSLMGDASVATVATPGGAMFARDPAAIPRFGSGSSAATLASGAIATSGAGQAHENMPPYQSLHFIIALEGVFPSQA